MVTTGRGLKLMKMKMWHEARKQEKKIRTLMVDYKRRADRRREFYEKIKQDPAQFLRVYGRPLKIHWEHSVALAAESPQSMMPWQGDHSIQIDRFDVRAHLDYIPEYVSKKEELEFDEEDAEERKCNYERYKILVQNQCAGVAEEQCLQQIYIDEMYGSQAEQSREKEKENEKKKLAPKKAAIGFKYEEEQEEESDKEEKGSDEDGDEEEEVSDIDLDAVFDVDKITPEQTVELNIMGRTFGMVEDDFFECLWQDKEDAEEIRMAKVMEEEKAQYSGRKSRRERRAYKEKRLAERGAVSPPSYAARNSPSYEAYKRDSSSSRSRSPVERAEPRFITCFGGSDDEVAQGPSLPPHLQPKSKATLSRLNRSESPPMFTEIGPTLKTFTPVTRARRSSSCTSSSRRASRRRSGGGSSRGGCGQGRSSSDSRSRSPSISRRFRSRTRSRSRSRRRSSRRSRSRRSRSRGSRRSRSRTRSRSRSRSCIRSRSYSRSRSRSRSYSRSRSRSQSTERTGLPSFRRRSLSKSDSEMSWSNTEDEEASKTSRQRSQAGRSVGKKESAAYKRLSIQEKMKKRMQKLVKQQQKADKKARQEKEEKEQMERIEREEELRHLAVSLRRKEREKRHKEREDYERMEKEERTQQRDATADSKRARRASREREKSESVDDDDRRSKERDGSKRSREPSDRSRTGEDRRSRFDRSDGDNGSASYRSGASGYDKKPPSLLDTPMVPPPSRYDGSSDSRRGERPPPLLGSATMPPSSSQGGRREGSRVDSQSRQSGTSDRYGGASDRFSGTSDRYGGGSDIYSGTSDRYSTSSNRYSGTSDRYSGTSDQHRGSSDRYRDNSERYSRHGRPQSGGGNIPKLVDY